jgi:hypothetical protein
MAKLSFKVYLMNDYTSEHIEVRRFGIDGDVATNYVYLREKLQTIFPELRGRSFTVTWRGERKISYLFLVSLLSQGTSCWTATCHEEVNNRLIAQLHTIPRFSLYIH